MRLERDQWLGELAALALDQDLVPSVYMIAHSCL